MRKRVLAILLTVILGLAGMLSPVCYAEAQEPDDKGILEQGAEIGEELYKKVDEAVSGIDKESLRRQIREALREMDEMGISPTVIARDLFGIRTNPAGKADKDGKKTGNTLLEDAEKTVRKKTEGFFTTLWNGFLDTLGGVIEAGFSMFSGKGGSSL